MDYTRSLWGSSRYQGTTAKKLQGAPAPKRSPGELDSWEHFRSPGLTCHAEHGRSQLEASVSHEQPQGRPWCKFCKAYTGFSSSSIHVLFWISDVIIWYTNTVTVSRGSKDAPPIQARRVCFQVTTPMPMNLKVQKITRNYHPKGWRNDWNDWFVIYTGLYIGLHYPKLPFRSYHSASWLAAFFELMADAVPQRSALLNGPGLLLLGGLSGFSCAPGFESEKAIQ